MQEQSVIHTTYVIERTYPVTPERVFAAFSDPAKKRRWFAEPRGPEGGQHQLDFRAGGSEVTRSIVPSGPFAGTALANDTYYADIVPNKRIVFAYTMTLGERRISASLATVELLPSERGTLLIFTDQAAFFEGADGPDMRKTGWTTILGHLDKELAN